MQLSHKASEAGEADIMGYSLGGGVALFVAVRNPELVGKLVIVSTPFRRNGYTPNPVQQGYVTAEAAER